MNYEDKTNRWIAIEVARKTGKRVALATEFYDGDGIVIYPHRSEINFDPCNNPSDAWPIIVENEISVDPSGEAWQFDGEAAKWHYEDGIYNNILCPKRPLRAAMICFLKIKEAEQ